MRRPVLSRNQQIHELPLAADRASCFPEARDVSVFESFAPETLRGKSFDGGFGRDRRQIQPRNVSLKFRLGLK